MYKVLTFILVIAWMFLPFKVKTQPPSDPVPFLQLALSFAENNQADSVVNALYPVKSLLYSVENRTKAQPYLEQLQKILEKKGQPATLAELYLVLQNVKLSEGEYDEAVAYSEKAIQKMKELPQPDTVKIAKAESFIGEAYFRKGDFSKASHSFQKGIQLLSRSGEVSNAAMYNLCYFSGIIAAERGHLQKAIEWMAQARAIALELHGKDHPVYATGLLSLGNIYTLKGDFDKALHYHQQALDKLIKIAGTDHPDIGYYWSNLARDYSQLGQHEQAELYFKKTLSAETKIYGSNHPLLAFTHSNIGRNYLNQGKLDQAKTYFEHALDLFLATMGNKNAYIPEVYNNLGELYLKKKEWDKSIGYFENAITANTGKIENDSLTPSLPETYFHPVHLIKSLLLKNEALLGRFEMHKNENDLRRALSNYKKGDELINKLRQSHIDQQDLISFNQIAGEFYANAMDACFLLFEQNNDSQQLVNLFQYAEKNKSMALLQAVKSMQALQYAGIADSLLEKENYLKKELATLEGRLIDPKQKGNFTTINQDYIIAKNEYVALIDFIEDKYPKYYKFKYNFSVAGISDIQSYLKNKSTAIIEYALGKDHLFVFLITENDFKVWRKDLNGLFEKIKDFRENHFSASFSSASSPATFAAASNELYLLLTSEPLKEINAGQINKLIFVPDGVLAYLPFDVLVEELPGRGENNFPSLAYLLNRFSCSYTWSVTLLQNQSDISPKKYAATYSGFAPAYDPLSDKILDSLEAAAKTVSFATRSDWSDLPAARESVQAIATMLKGTAFMSGEANKKNFLNSVSSTRILHLAMHGFLDDDDPLFSGLAFGNNKNATTDHLYAWELYSLDINAELAVLSACETGVGELKKGEGLMSLSRAFTYAGCPAVVMSLWSIPDEASASIIKDFHQKLKSGSTKDEALRAAKLNYLKNNELPQERLHPFFWAGFIQTGDPRAMAFENGIPVSYWAFGFLAAAFLAVVLGRRKKYFFN